MSEGGPPESAGRPHEAGGNTGPRWMAVSPGAARARGDRTRLTGRLVRRPYVPRSGPGPGAGGLPAASPPPGVRTYARGGMLEA